MVYSDRFSKMTDSQTEGSECRGASIPACFWLRLDDDPLPYSPRRHLSSLIDPIPVSLSLEDSRLSSNVMNMALHAHSANKSEIVERASKPCKTPAIHSSNSPHKWFLRTARHAEDGKPACLSHNPNAKSTGTCRHAVRESGESFSSDRSSFVFCDFIHGGDMLRVFNDSC